jgi:MFS family permease
MCKTKINDWPVLFLVANSISWFSLTMLIIGDFVSTYSLTETLIIPGAYFGGLIASAAVGATVLCNVLKEKRFLALWILLGAIASILFSFAVTEGSSSLMLTALFLGATTGLGIPTCFAFFADKTKIVKRGKAAAVMFFVIQLVSATIIFFTYSAGSDYQFTILAIWRVLGLIGLIGYAPLQKISQEKTRTSLKAIVRERTFILYFVPWFLFTLVNFIEAPIVEVYFGPEFNNMVVITTLINSIAAFIGGVLCDLKGRKITGILGFVLLGLAYAFLSFFSSGPTNDIAPYLYVLFDGLAWGILFVTFIFVLWGDLSEEKVREKYYLIGSLPFLFSGMIEMLIHPIVKSIPISTSFSLATFFLFLAIVPLLYATETLPEKAMKDRDLKSYLDKAQKIAEKEANKTQHKEKTKTEKKEEPEPVEEENSKEYEEAQKLAEQYY